MTEFLFCFSLYFFPLGLCFEEGLGLIKMEAVNWFKGWLGSAGRIAGFRRPSIVIGNEVVQLAGIRVL